MAKNDIINWEAKEHISYDRNVLWYIVFFLVVAGLCALAVFLQQYTFLILVIIAGVALMTYTLRPPRTLHYSLNKEGLSEGNNLYKFEDFKSFGVLNEKGKYSIVLTPKKRFSFNVRVFFPESSGEQIVDVFGARLPMEAVKMDFLDKIISILRI